MTLDYGAETPPSEFLNPPTLVRCIGLPGGQVKLLSFQAKLSDIWRCADALPLHHPKQHVVCLHHFNESMKFDRSLAGRIRREITGEGDVAFLPADGPTRLRPALKDKHRVLSYSYLLVEPAYLAEMALSNGISCRLEFIPRFATADPLLHQMTAALTNLPVAADATENLLSKPCSTPRVPSSFPVRDAHANGVRKTVSPQNSSAYIENRRASWLPDAKPLQRAIPHY